MFLRRTIGMNRRQFLITAGGWGVAALAGCVETSGSKGYVPTTPEAPESVAKWTFNTQEAETEEGTEAKPSVRCEAERNTVTITGKMYSGSDCQMVGVTAVSQNADAFRFGVGIYEGRETSCSDGVDVSAYEAVFKFADSLPEAVVATEGLETERRTEKRCS